MARGNSGRVVIEMDPNLKRELHTALASRGLTVKEWFIRHAEDFLEAPDQLELPSSYRGQNPQDEDKASKSS